MRRTGASTRSAISSPCSASSSGEHVLAVDEHAADPGQVVEPDLVDEHARRLDVVELGDPALEADRDVAEADRTMARVEQRARDDADRVREVDDPGTRSGALAHALGDLEDDGHRAKRLREAARSGRLLADAAARERHGLVRRAAPSCPPTRIWTSTKFAPSSARSRSSVTDERAAEALRVEHARGEPADDLAALRVDVVEDELFDRQPLALAREPGHELGRVRRAAADDRDLHPLTPVSVTPSTNAFCARKKTTITGSITSTVAAIVRFHCTWCSERNCERPIDVTQLSGFSLR